MFAGRDLCGCAVCGSGVGVHRFHLTHGESVELCTAHGSANFLRRRGGKAFTEAIRRHWRDRRGSLTSRQVAALMTHPLRVTGRFIKDGPGSYSHVALRCFAECEFAEGATPADVTARIHSEFDRSLVAPPAARTIRRWFFEGRWLAAPALLAQRWSTSRTGRNKRDVIAVRRSKLGMCLFHPGLALVQGVDLGLAVSEAVESMATFFEQAAGRISRTLASRR